MKVQLKKYLIRLVGARLNLLYRVAPHKAAKECFKILATPRGGQIKAEQRTFLYTAQKEKISVGGRQIQTYFWPGGAENVLLVHGWESNAGRWKELVQKLQSENYGVIALDAPAHGDSDGKRFSEPLYGKAIMYLAKKYKPAYAVGHSLGGSTLLLQHHQEKIPYIEKMVLLAPASEMKNIADLLQQRLGLNTRLLAEVEGIFKAEFGYDFYGFSLRKFTKDFELPSLFIHDKDDRTVSYKETMAIMEEWENATLLLTKGLGHTLKSTALNEAIANFLKTGIV